jgi:hypothetical protein
VLTPVFVTLDILSLHRSLGKLLLASGLLDIDWIDRSRTNIILTATPNIVITRTGLLFDVQGQIKAIAAASGSSDIPQICPGVCNINRLLNIRSDMIFVLVGVPAFGLIKSVINDFGNTSINVLALL